MATVRNTLRALAEAAFVAFCLALPFFFGILCEHVANAIGGIPLAGALAIVAAICVFAWPAGRAIARILGV